MYAGLGFPPITAEEIAAAATAYDSRDMPDRDVPADLAAAETFLRDERTILDVIRVLDAGGMSELAGSLLELGRQRVLGDYLQPAAVFAEGFRVKSAINDANDYAGPGSGYRLQAERWERLQAISTALEPERYLDGQGEHPAARLRELETAQRGSQPEVVLALGPAFGQQLTETIHGLPHEDVLEAILGGIASEGLPARIVKVYHTADCAFIGYAGAQLSGSGVAVGLQSRGTTVIHRADLAPLNNLELFPQSPSLTLDTYRQIGRNAACYALGLRVRPVPVTIDNWARLRLIVKTMLLHRREMEQVAMERAPVEMHFDWEPDVPSEEQP